MYSLEEIHSNLDSIETAISELDSVRDGFNEQINVSDLNGEAWLILGELHSNGLASDLGLNPSMLRRMVDLNKSVRVAVAKATFERVRTYLRTLESSYSARVSPPTSAEVSTPLPPPTPTSPQTHVEIVSETWIYVRGKSDVQELISTISVLLDEVILISGHTNIPPEEAALTEIERQQLIAILETALAMLKGPMVEPGLLKKLRDMATSAAKKSVEKEAERAMGLGLEKLAEFLLSLISKLG